MTRPITALLAAVVLPLLGGCAEDVVNVYNSRHYGSDVELYRGFTEATGIRVNVVEGNNDELIQRLASEGANSPADIMMTVDAGRLSMAAAKDLFQPVESNVLDAAIPAHLRHPDGLWYGLSVRARVLVYAKDRVDPARLSTYEALADPALEGRLLVRSSNNIYNQSLVASILAANGPEATEAWARGVVANFARAPQGGDTDQIRAVAAGQGDVAIANTYYVGRLLDSDKPEDRAVAGRVGIFFPNQGDRGTHVNISGAGVTKHAPNRENAVRLLEYLATDAQRYFSDVNNEYPANPEVRPNDTLAAFGAFTQDALNAAVYGENSAEAIRIMDRAGWK